MTAPRPLSVGDWIKSNDSRDGHRPAYEVTLISAKWLGQNACRYYIVAEPGAQGGAQQSLFGVVAPRPTRMWLSSVHVDGKPRRTGWSRVEKPK